MGARNLSQNALAVNFFIATDQTSDTQGTGINTVRYDELLVVMSVGTIAGTAATLDVTMQNSDAVGGSYSDITINSITAAFAQISTSNDASIYTGRINLRELANRWIRADLDFGGTVSACPVAIVGLLYNTGQLPITQVPALSFNASS